MMKMKNKMIEEDTWGSKWNLKWKVSREREINCERGIVWGKNERCWKLMYENLKFEIDIWEPK